VYKKVREYEYSVCLFGHAKQDKVLIGKFSDWGHFMSTDSQSPTPSPTQSQTGGGGSSGNGGGRDDPSSSFFTSQIYDQGAMCLGAAFEPGPGKERPRRRTQVTLTCAPNFEIVEVEEAERCTYLVTVSSPLACQDHMEAASTRRLEQLGVFGFSGGGGGGGGATSVASKHPQLSAATAGDMGVDGIAIVSRQ
jgi:hypothetical protein